MTGPRILFANCEPRLTGPELTGHIAAEIAAGGGQIEWIDLHKGERPPADATGHDGLVLPGGEISVFDPAHAATVDRLCDLYLSFQAADKPVLGSCLGGQIMVRALGGRVERMGYTEFGFEALSTTPEAADDPVFGPVAGTHRIFEVHRDRFEFPPGSVPMMRGIDEPNQIFRVGGASYGFQCHFEVTRELALKWIRMMEQELLPWLGPDGPERVARARRDLEIVMPAAASFARRVMAGWLGLFEAKGHALKQTMGCSR
jgi:GMP synthase-like glutamine amidotransferase